MNAMVPRIPPAIAALVLSTAGCSENGFRIPDFNITFGMAVADLDRDGALDLIGANASGRYPHPGHAVIFARDPTASPEFGLPARYPTGLNSLSVAVGDVDDDGWLDLVLANGDSGDVSVLIQAPAAPGTFLPARNYVAGPFPRGVELGDLDQDGRLDVVVADIGDGLSILHQDPASPGQFLSPVVVGPPCESLAVGDLDGDGRVDVAANATTEVVLLLQSAINPGDLIPAAQLETGSPPLSAVLADVDLDGATDVVVGSAAGGSGPGLPGVSVFLQDGRDGGFFPRMDLVFGVDGTSVGVEDIDADGLPDVVVAGGTLLQVFFQIPDDPGTFIPGDRVGGVSLARQVVPADLDGDGRTELVVTDDGFLLFDNDPGRPGSFLPPVALGN